MGVYYGSLTSFYIYGESAQVAYSTFDIALRSPRNDPAISIVVGSGGYTSDLARLAPVYSSESAIKPEAQSGHSTTPWAKAIASDR
jgi:hypothetical protein